MKEPIDLSVAREAKTQQTHPSPDGPIDAVPWSGDLEAQVLKGEVKGEPLFAALQNRARQLGQTLQEMCRCLDFSYPYYSQLRSGRRSLSGASDDFTHACARYLGVPRLTILALADIVSPQDMVQSQEAVITHLPRAFEHVCTDPYWAHLATASVRHGSFETQYLIVRLYEQMTGLQLLPPTIAPERLAESMAVLQSTRANLHTAASVEGPKV